MGPISTLGHHARSTRARAFTLFEVIAVVALMGVLASLAAPSITELVRTYRADEGARSVLAAFTRARGLAYRKNAPIVVEIASDKLVLKAGEFGPPPHGFLMTASAWTPFFEAHFTDGVRIVDGGTLSVGDQIAFCPSGEYRFVDGTGQVSPDGVGGPACAVGDLASRGGTLHFQAAGASLSLGLLAPLATMRIGGGP